jgi:phosphate transport system substrate-binding protein
MKRMNNEMAVSPIVATLVLIVVAVIGAVAVGTIMGTFSTQVSKQASSSQAASASQNEIIIAGSTTAIPVEQNIAADYERANPGVQINVQGGGSSVGPQSVALGIADIGAVSGASTITSAVTNNPTSQIYQNLYFTQIGGRGVVFIQSANTSYPNGNAFSYGSNGGIAAGDVAAIYNNLYSDGTIDVGTFNSKVTAADVVAVNTAGNISVYQREAGSATMGTAFKWAGLTTTQQSNGVTNALTATSNAALLADVQAGTGAKPAFGFVDSGYAITGGSSSNTTASGISVVDIYANSHVYVPTHINIKNALKDWYYGKAQDTTVVTSSPAAYESLNVNYPQGLVGGLYWITTGSAPSTFNGNQITEGTSSASSIVTGLIQFAKSPNEVTAFSNAGVYSMYDFIN